MVLVVAMLLGTGALQAFAASAGSDVIVADISGAITADPEGNYQLAQDVLAEQMNQISGYTADETVTFIVELEGSALLDTKPETQSMGQYMASSAGVTAIARIDKEQSGVLSLVKKAVSGGFTVDYTYQVVMNGFAVTGPYSMKAELEAIDGVKSVTVAQTYQYEEPVAGYTAVQTSGSMMDSDSANAAGYTGKGTVTAILDTGLDLEHEAFANDPEAPALDLEDISAAVASGNLNAAVSAEQLYKSAKIPFAYDYTSADADVNDPISHGTHVAGTVGADCESFSGVAPDTQLVIMKVFNDSGSGATDAVIFAALEDAVILGVDSINMSLGIPCGFTTEDELTDAVYNKVKDAGINLMVSAGNEYNASLLNNLGTDLPLVSEPDNAIVGSPSTYSAAMSVASINEYTEYSTYLLAGEAHIGYTDANVDTALDFVQSFDGQTLEYVYVPGFGSADDFATVDVTGKIALVARGELAFTEKEANAYSAGAVAMIVFDNVEGDMIYMQGNGLIPMIFITKADGLTLRDMENKTISISSEHQEFLNTSDGGQMSDFSSLGVAPDLTLKPEITAPGGYVYSTLPGGIYGSMSGTSMASPHMAGAASVVRQYVNEAFPGMTDIEKQTLINTLLMNTASIVEDATGVPYTPRKQGAGLAQVNDAISTGAYVTVEGSEKPKAELGDSANGYFSKEVTLTIHNITDSQLTYNMSAIAMTTQEEVVSVYGVAYDCISESDRILSDSEFDVRFSENTVTVPANGTASITVKLRLTTEGEESLEAFVNGTFLEGYIVLESAEDDGIDLSVPYLGFYGDWGQASVFDDSMYSGEDASVYASAMAMFDLNSGSGYYLGSNMYSDGLLVDENKIAVSYEMLNYGYRPFTMLGLLRAPKTLTYTVTDGQGDLVALYDESYGFDTIGYEYTVSNVIKSFYYTSGGYINYEMGPMYYGWYPLQDLGGGYIGWLDNGTYHINVTAQVDGTDSAAGTQSVSFPITIDSQAPQLLSSHYEEVDGVPYVTIDLTDNHYLMAFQLVSPDGMMAFSPVIPVDETEAGTISSFTFDVSLLLEYGYTSAYVYAYDYALNGVSAEFALNGDTEQATGVTIVNQNITKSGDGVIEIEAYIQPEGLEDTTLTWTSSDESVATVRATGETRYDSNAGITLYIAEVTTKNVDGTATITATASNGVSGSTTVTVIGYYQDLPSDYVIREDGTYILPADLNTKVTITDNAQNVVVVGNSANTKDSPYKDLSLYSTVSNLNLTIRDLNVTSTVYSTWGTPAAAPTIQFTGAGNTLTLEGESTFVGVAYGSYALVQVDSGTELTVTGTGTLNLTQPGNTNGAALGSQAGYPCGTIVIEGGTLNATTEGYGAAIGGGAGANAPSITINGGTVNASSHYAMAGWSYNQNYAGAAIGAGNGAYGGTNSITINGGEVTATTSTNSAAIGGALYSSWSQGSDTTTVTINGGKVVASTINEGGTANAGGAAIGSSYYGGTANITVNGGEVIAITGNAAAGIGSGYYAKAANVTVNGGTVSALANSTYTSDAYHGAAIGKGAYATAGTIYINKGAVAANTIGSVYNSNYDALSEVVLTIPGVTGLTIDGEDWKVSANHADFTANGGSDWSDQVHIWLAEQSAAYDVVAETGDGTIRLEVYADGSAYAYHTVTYVLNGLTTDGAEKVYDPSVGETYNADLTGTLTLVDDTMALPTAISVTVDGVEVEAAYDAATGTFAVAKELLTGDVVVTAAAQPIVDKSALNDLIETAQALDPEDYTGASWTEVEDALAEAVAVAADSDATQTEVDAAYAVLKAAVDALTERADNSALVELIETAKALDEDDYTTGTWAALEDALAAAEAVAADSNATAEEIAAAYDALKAAMDALVQPGDKTELRELIDKADSLFESDYSQGQWEDSGIEDALADAVAVYTDPDATQEEIDAACEALREALEKLAACDGGEKCPSAAYDDVNKDAWYHEAIDYMIENGYMNGMSTNMFGTELPLTRAQMVTILYRVAGSPSVEGMSHPFVDMADGAWYTDAIVWAYNSEIVNGMTLTTFGPDEKITREQIVTILYRMSGSPETAEDVLSQFTDGDKVGAYAVDAMNWAVSTGLVQGSLEGGDLLLLPLSNATRAQAVVMMYRFLNN